MSLQVLLCAVIAATSTACCSPLVPAETPSPKPPASSGCNLSSECPPRALCLDGACRAAAPVSREPWCSLAIGCLRWLEANAAPPSPVASAERRAFATLLTGTACDRQTVLMTKDLHPAFREALTPPADAPACPCHKLIELVDL